MQICMSKQDRGEHRKDQTHNKVKEAAKCLEHARETKSAHNAWRIERRCGGMASFDITEC